MKTQQLYRPAVCAIFVSNNNLILSCKRSDNGDWQLPQGGIEAGETPGSALRREMREELGLVDFTILAEGAHTSTYDWPHKNKHNETGQVIHWFLCQLKESHPPDLKASDRTFAETAWGHPQQLLDKLVSWKKRCFTQGFMQFQLIQN